VSVEDPDYPPKKKKEQKATQIIHLKKKGTKGNKKRMRRCEDY
jgi:hypothetical protein